MKYLLLFLFALPIFFSETSLRTELSTVYVWPVGGHKMITGSFGEFRMFYFHHGLDFATEGRIGVPILAMQSGKITKVQSLRYSIGNAILIKQNDGFTARYGHMDKFSDRVKESLPEDTRSKLDVRQDFDRELQTGEEVFVSAGELIGYSGNTGIGPAHLHVELMKNDFYYNPADFLPEPDTKGEIQVTELELIPIDTNSFIEGKNLPYNVKVKKNNSSFLPLRSEPLKIKGKIGIMVSGYEASGRTNRIGFQKLTVRFQDAEIQDIDLHKIKNTQMLRSCYIFDNYKSTMSGKPFKYYLFNREKDSIDSFKYKDKNAGIIYSDWITPDKISRTEITLEGMGGKTSSVFLDLITDSEVYPANNGLSSFNVIRDNKSVLRSQDENIILNFSETSVFFSENFSIEPTEIKVSDPGIEQLSSVYKVSPDYREFNSGYELTFKSGFSLENLPEKIGLFGITEKGKILRYYQTAVLSPDTLNYKLQLKSTGQFAVLKDSSPPSLRVMQYKSGIQFSNREFKIFLRATDIGSGVGEKGIKATIDSEPGLLDYDPEANTWELFSSPSMRQPGEHILEAKATDRLGNTSPSIRFVYSVKE